MKLKTNKNLKKTKEKKSEIKRIRSELKKKYMTNYNLRTKLKT